jgi:ATP phosphoribosyltransferase
MKLALPKGRLFEGVIAWLADRGVTFDFKNDRDYSPQCSDPATRPRVRKVRAIPQLLSYGIFDAGFCGLDLLEEGSCYKEVWPVLDLGLNPVKLVVAIHESQAGILEAPPPRPLVIASEYENIAHQWAWKRGLAHILVNTYGSTEGYAPEDADIVFDCVETGATMEANGLVVVETVMDSSTWLVANKEALHGASSVVRDWIDRLREER